MAWVRQLDSGVWAATVRLPTGKRVTESFVLKGAARTWADDLESDVRRGDWIDPRAGRVTVGEWRERTRDSRRLERASRKRDESHWRCHVEPHWGRVPIGGILRPDVTAWVVKLEKAGTGAATIQGSVGVLRGLFDLAVDARLIRVNPARGVRMPRRTAHLDRVLAPEEDGLLFASLDRQFPGRADARLMCEVMLYCGLRWEECGALDRAHLELRRQLVKVGPVLERDGTIRPYPKSKAGIRDVPVPRELWPRLRDHALTVQPGGLLFTAARGKVLHYSSWHRRVWQRALFEVVERGRRGQIICQSRILDDPQPTPHDLRHSYGTRLAEQGVPPHEIMSLIGHERLESVQRYLHAGQDRFDRARDALAKVMSQP